MIGAIFSRSAYVLLGIWVHEEHGTVDFAKIYGSLLTFGAIGVAVFEKWLFNFVYNRYHKETEHDEYGKWNHRLFYLTTAFTCFAACLGWIGYCCGKRNEKSQLKVERIPLRLNDLVPTFN